jgi:hypothetical protein
MAASSAEWRRRVADFGHGEGVFLRFALEASIAVVGGRSEGVVCIGCCPMLEGELAWLLLRWLGVGINGFSYGLWESR